MNIVFMGTPDFAKDSLEAIYEKGHNISAVITVPDKAKGRGMKVIYSPVKEYAIEKELKIYQPEKLRENQEIIETIKDIKPDVICVVAYGRILPEEILNIPKFGCINVHPSLLPKYRGSAPIQWAILNGDKTTGVTTMYLNNEMDAGDIILKREVKIDADENSGELWTRLSKIGADLLVETLEQVEKEQAPRIKQEGEFSIAPMLEKSMAKINWEEKGMNEIKNLVRGLNPIMGAYANFKGKKTKIWKVQTLEVNQFVEEYSEFKEYAYKFKDIEPGTILYIDNKKGIYVRTKDGVILILEIQQENSKRMSTPDFLRGNQVDIVDKFE
ncbi:MAG: methionyl-tRNA formyltransferase [Clostridiales bacterium]|nr:methionyl-tRNA formyltransferase [Clostridiales bacterium]